MIIWCSSYLIMVIMKTIQVMTNNRISLLFSIPVCATRQMTGDAKILLTEYCTLVVLPRSHNRRQPSWMDGFGQSLPLGNFSVSTGRA